MQKVSASTELKDAMISAFLAALIARYFARHLGSEQKEEAFLCGMFHSTGRTLTIYYLPEDFAEITNLMAAHGLNPVQASREILGVTFAELAVAVACDWKFPDKIINTISDPPEDTVPPPISYTDWLRCYAMLANQLCELAGTEKTGTDDYGLATLLERYSPCCKLTPEQVRAILRAALDKLSSYAPTLGITLQASPYLAGVSRWAEATESEDSDATAKPEETTKSQEAEKGPDDSSCSATSTLS